MGHKIRMRKYDKGLNKQSLEGVMVMNECEGRGEVQAQ